MENENWLDQTEVRCIEASGHNLWSQSPSTMAMMLEAEGWKSFPTKIFEDNHNFSLGFWTNNDLERSVQSCEEG